MKRLFSLIGFCIFCHGLSAQTFTDSNLPIVIINIDGGTGIPDAPRVFGSMKIIYSGTGQRNYLSDQDDINKLNYSGRLEIEVRGSSSQNLSKKQYGLTTLKADNTSNNNVSLLGMPKENDWVLNGLAFDASLIRDYLSYNLSRQIGNYAPRTQYCEVVINNDYQGLYILQEKVKADDNRVDIVKLESSDAALPELSGGYIMKSDKVSGDDPTAWKASSNLGTNDVDFIHEFPKTTSVTTLQYDYIKGRFDKLSATASAGNTSAADGYPSVIDIPSFVDFMLVNELAANVDAYQFSTYFHKDRNGKLRAGPLWDLNLTYGNDLFFWGFDRSKTNTWQFNNSDNNGAKFWIDLFNNSTFKCYMSRRWNQLTQGGQPLNPDIIKAFIDQTVATISEAADREQQRWGTIGIHSTHINGVKNFIDARKVWMTNNLGSFSNCNSVTTPPLVITRISYHPDTNIEFDDSDDQEFIEIMNTGNQNVSLTGVYFSGTGLGYQFPAGAILQPQGVLQIANDKETFQRLYGFSPFGEFARNLSNDAQKITLADAFGNGIDQVSYTDDAPWPDADGTGAYLKLSDVSLDNAQGANWVASSEPVSTTIVGNEEDESDKLELYPNPSDGKVNVSSRKMINTIHLRDVHGRLFEEIDVHDQTHLLDMTRYSAGVYLLAIRVHDKVYVRKVIRK